MTGTFQIPPDDERHPRAGIAGSPQAGEERPAACLEHLAERLFLRALQFVFGGVLFGIAFFPVRHRGSVLDLLVAAMLLALAISALVWRRALLERLRARPLRTLLFPLPPLIAVTLDGGFDSVWTPLVAITVGVPATLGLPWLSLGGALITATGQAAAAWINRGDSDSDQLLETTIFSGAGTVAVGVGVALSVATLADFLYRRSEVLARLREMDPALAQQPDHHEAVAPQRQLASAARVRLSPAELRVVALLAAGWAPKQVAVHLNISVNTVRSHLKAAKRKAQARTLSELVGLFVIEEGQL